MVHSWYLTWAHIAFSSKLIDVPFQDNSLSMAAYVRDQKFRVTLPSHTKQSNYRQEPEDIEKTLPTAVVTGHLYTLTVLKG